MNKKMYLGIWMLILIVLSGSIFALDVQYINPDTDTVLKESTLTGVLNSSLPSRNLTVKFDEGDIFYVTIPNLNTTEFSTINITFRDINISELLNSTHDIGPEGSGENYKVIDSYAFDIFNSTNFDKLFEVEFDYTTYIASNISSETRIRLFKAEYNFTSNKTQFETLANTGVSPDTTNKKISTTTTNFSIFMLVEDKTPAPYVPPSGGGGSSGSSTYTDYDVGGPVFIVNCSNGIKDFGEKGIDCGPICKIECPKEGEVIEEPEIEDALGIGEQGLPRQPITEAPAIIPRELIAPVEGVQKPIDLLTLALGVVFIIVLIGGFAIYRSHHMTGKIPYPSAREHIPPLLGVKENKPTLEPIPLKSQGAKQEPLHVEHFNVAKELGKEGTIKQETEKIEKREPEVSAVAMQKLVDYVHAEEDKSFGRDRIMSKLMIKGWPQNLILESFRLVDSMKESINPSVINKMHKYIMKEFGKGFQENIIKIALIKKSWPEFIVNEAFNQLRILEQDMKQAGLHVVTENIERAKVGVKSLVIKGYDKKKIFDALVLAGWESDKAKVILR